MTIPYQDIIEALKQPLPGSRSHRKMLPNHRNLTIPPSDQTRVKSSSVLLLLYPDDNDIFGCLIKRPKHMRHHAGQIALPGGKIEKNETALQTAFRETSEEIGLQTNNIKVLGKLSELYVDVSGFLIHPFIGWLNEKPKFEINKNEVDKMVLFPLFTYKNNFDWVELVTTTGKINVPCIKFEDEIIWGATAMILSEFYDVMAKFEATRQ
jgi:8-oxo-dGTP pyrophosphatase MutT (NUDIX family)